MLVSDFQPVVFSPFPPPIKLIVRIWLKYIIIFKKTKSIFSVHSILGDGVQRHFQQYFSHILTISFIGGGNGEKTTG
jgi:hypothetical protein